MRIMFNNISISFVSCGLDSLLLNWKTIRAISLVLIIYPLTSTAEIYKWVDENGEVHYSETAPEETPQPRWFLPVKAALPGY